MDVISSILPVIDNFERALQVPQDQVADDVKSFIDGYEMIYKQLLGVLERKGSPRSMPSANLSTPIIIRLSCACPVTNTMTTSS